jgi:hypothetical protein
MGIPDILLGAIPVFVILLLVGSLVWLFIGVVKSVRKVDVAIRHSKDSIGLQRREIDTAEQRYEESMTLARRSLEQSEKQTALLERILAALEDRRGS